MTNSYLPQKEPSIFELKQQTLKGLASAVDILENTEDSRLAEPLKYLRDNFQMAQASVDKEKGVIRDLAEASLAEEMAKIHSADDFILMARLSRSNLYWKYIMRLAVPKLTVNL